MIVSHRHRFIFVAIPKTGTHSVRQALRAHLGPEDIEQVGLFVDKRFPIADLAAIRHGHLGLEQVRPFLAAAVEGYFKFAFVRNPFDRFVSYCAFMTRANGAFERDPKAVMRHVLFKAPPLQHILFRPQHELLVDAQGALLTDFVGRVERMQDDYAAACSRIGIAPAPLDKVNSSRRGAYRDYYEPDLIEGVRAFYRRDLELFDYDF